MNSITSEHPGRIAAQKYIEYLTAKHEAKSLRQAAATARKQAKLSDPETSKKLRDQAKSESAKARDLMAEARALRLEIIASIQDSAKLLIARMPSDYTDWGVVKTRAYVKVLGVLSAQSKRDNPNIDLTTDAIRLLLDHQKWGDSTMSRLAVISSMPKTLS